MKAARLFGVGDLRIQQIDAPSEPPPGHIVVKIGAVGVCGSDVHNYKTGEWFSDLPVTPGHEFAGEVVMVGDQCKQINVGDNVIADSRVPCMKCVSCLSGRPNICLNMGYVGEVCDGGFAEYVTLPETQVIAYPNDIAPELAALSEPLGVALHVIRRANPDDFERVIVAGAGAIGGLSLILLDHFGYKDVSFLERAPERITLLSRLTGAQSRSLEDMAAYVGEKPCCIIETTGGGAVASALLDAACPGSRIAMVGIFSSSVDLNLNRIVEGEIDLVGSSVFVDEQAEALMLIPKLASSLAEIVSASLPLEDLPEQMKALSAGRSADIKTIVRP